MRNRVSANAITLVPLDDADVEAIRQWPLYPPWAKDLDYALRRGGWLDRFSELTGARRFSAWHGGELVGFSILTDVANGDAEFYVAVHPNRIGLGIGRAITHESIRIAFEEMGLFRIHLKVREWHQRGIALYQSEGFKATGTCIEEVQNCPVSFVTMEIRKIGAES